MPVVTENFQLAAVERRLEFAQDFGTEIIGDRFHVVRIGREDDPAVRRHRELAKSVILDLKIGGHTALAGSATTERNADQIAFEIVRPLMVRADERPRVAAQLTAKFRRPMHAAVLEHADRAVLAAGHDDRRRSHVGANEIPGIRHFGFERHIVPCASVENAFDLALVDFLIRVDPVRDDRQIVIGPDIVILREIDVCQGHACRPSSASAASSISKRLVVAIDLPPPDCPRTLAAPDQGDGARRRHMAQEPLATKGNYLHIYDFRVEQGKEAEFIRLFEAFDYSDGNPMHKSWAQVKDGVLCRDTEDPQRFFLIAEWSDIEEHARIRKILANDIKPEFIKYIEGRKFVPKYVEVVSSTPDEILKKAAAE